MKNSPTKPWYKRWKPWAIIILALGIFGNLLPDQSPEPAADAEPVAKAPAAKAEPAVKESEEADAVQPVQTDSTVQPVQPLTKDEVLAKFPLVAGEEPYIDGTFAFVGNRTDTADYYSLEDTDRYRNASVIFKDGEIARVKFIPEGDTDPAEFLAEFGITEKPRELGGMIKSYEVALIPMYWSQNIERYPFESEY